MALSTIDMRVLVSVALLSVCVTAAAAQTFTTREGTVTFTSAVPLHEFEGVSHDLNGMISLADSTVDFFVDLETLKTGIGKRDRDMRRTLETDAFPFAEFTGKLVSRLDVSLETAQEAVVRGEFTIHGVSRDVEITGEITPDGEALQLTASWTLSLEDYSIEPPSLLFMKVDPIQVISIAAILHTRDP